MADQDGICFWNVNSEHPEFPQAYGILTVAGFFVFLAEVCRRSRSTAAAQQSYSNHDPATRGVFPSSHASGASFSGVDAPQPAPTVVDHDALQLGTGSSLYGILLDIEDDKEDEALNRWAVGGSWAAMLYAVVLIALAVSNAYSFGILESSAENEDRRSLLVQKQLPRLQLLSSVFLSGHRRSLRDRDEDDRYYKHGRDYSRHDEEEDTSTNGAFVLEVFECFFLSCSKLTVAYCVFQFDRKLSASARAVVGVWVTVLATAKFLMAVMSLILMFAYIRMVSWAASEGEEDSEV